MPGGVAVYMAVWQERRLEVCDCVDGMCVCVCFATYLAVWQETCIGMWIKMWLLCLVYARGKVLCKYVKGCGYISLNVEVQLSTTDCDSGCAFHVHRNRSCSCL